MADEYLAKDVDGINLFVSLFVCLNRQGLGNAVASAAQSYPCCLL